MAGEQYADLVVEALLDHFESNLATQIAAVETAQSLTAGVLPDPTDFIYGHFDEDPRPQQLQVWIEGGGPVEEYATSTDRIAEYDCRVHYSYLGDADVEAGKLVMRQVLTAMINTLYVDRTLSGKVVMAVDDGHDLNANKVGDAQTRHTATLNVAVTVHET